MFYFCKKEKTQYRQYSLVPWNLEKYGPKAESLLGYFLSVSPWMRPNSASYGLGLLYFNSIAF